MGPGLFSPDDILSGASVAVGGLQLQWGRAYSARMTTGDWATETRDFIASMGPGLFSPDDIITNGVGMAKLIASMGPGLFSPDDCLTRQQLADGAVASMGPGLFSPDDDVFRRHFDGLDIASMGPGLFSPDDAHLTLEASVCQLGGFNGAGLIQPG